MTAERASSAVEIDSVRLTAAAPDCDVEVLGKRGGGGKAGVEALKQ